LSLFDESETFNAAANRYPDNWFQRDDRNGRDREFSAIIIDMINGTIKASDFAVPLNHKRHHHRRFEIAAGAFPDQRPGAHGHPLCIPMSTRLEAHPACELDTPART
jgi:hypothetical protein